MAVLVESAAGLDFGGAVFETSIGTKCCVIYAGGLKAYKNIDTTPSQMGSTQTAATMFGSGGTSGTFHAAIDSNDVIHVVIGATTAATRDVAYNTITGVDSTPAWGTWEEAAAYTDWDDTANGAAWITIDSNDAPHVAYLDDIRNMGTRYQQIRYTEKTGASWATPQTVSTQSEEQHEGPHCSMDSADDVHFLYKSIISATASDAPIYRLYDGASFGTEDFGATNDAELGMSLAVQGTTPHFATVEGGTTPTRNILHGTDVDTLSDTGFNGSNGAVSNWDNIKIYVTATDEYILHIDGTAGGTTRGNVDLISDTGSGWSLESQVQTGEYWTVAIGWQYNNLNNTTCIDYLFSNHSSGGIYWDEYCIAEEPRRVFITHV